MMIQKDANLQKSIHSNEKMMTKEMLSSQREMEAKPTFSNINVFHTERQNFQSLMKHSGKENLI